MRQFGAEVATEFETQGLVGRPLFWRRDREQLLNDLAGILKFDHQREPRNCYRYRVKICLPGADFPPLKENSHPDELWLSRQYRPCRKSESRGSSRRRLQDW